MDDVQPQRLLPEPASPVSVRVGSATSPGRVRRVNEDSFLAEWPLYVVADGMGGHAAGDRASALAVEELRRLAGRPLTADDVHAALQRAAASVDDLARDTDTGAGTTVAGAVLVEQSGTAYWLVLNVGDSRVYLLDADGLTQVTVDHSVVQELIDEGRLTVADARTHPERHVVTRALGAGGHSAPDFWLFPVVGGERLLVCSDGLTTELDEAVLERALREHAEPQAAVDALLSAALASGGRDNVTLLVVDALVGDAPAERTRPHPLAEPELDRTRPRSEVARP